VIPKDLAATVKNSNVALQGSALDAALFPETAPKHLGSPEENKDT
jgi:hypothetical protein